MVSFSGSSVRNLLTQYVLKIIYYYHGVVKRKTGVYMSELVVHYYSANYHKELFHKLLSEFENIYTVTDSSYNDKEVLELRKDGVPVLQVTLTKWVSVYIIKVSTDTGKVFSITSNDPTIVVDILKTRAELEEKYNTDAQK